MRKKKISIEWTNKERWRVRRMRRKQAKQLRVLARQFGVKTKTEAKTLLKEMDAEFKQRLEREP